MADKTLKKDGTKRADADWVELCEYIKLEILQYPDEMKYPRRLAVRIRGLLSGNFISNKKQKPLASYTVEQLMLTCKLQKYQILNMLSRMHVKDENHRVNLVMMKIEENVNDTVMKMKNVKKSEKKVEKLDIPNMTSDGVDYKDKVKDKSIKDKEKVAKKLKDLW